MLRLGLGRDLADFAPDEFLETLNVVASTPVVGSTPDAIVRRQLVRAMERTECSAHFAEIYTRRGVVQKVSELLIISISLMRLLSYRTSNAT